MAEDPDPQTAVPEARLVATVTGNVQGVGFRYWVRAEAEELGLNGVATNQLDGSVEVVAEGTREAAEKLLRALKSGRTPGRVDEVDADFADATGDYIRFHVR